MLRRLWDRRRKRWHGFQRRDLDLVDLITWSLKCPAPESDPELSDLYGSHGCMRRLKATGDIRNCPLPHPRNSTDPQPIAS